MVDSEDCRRLKGGGENIFMTLRGTKESLPLRGVDGLERADGAGIGDKLVQKLR